MIKKYFTKKHNNKVRDFVDANYPIIDVIPGECHFNYKCHLMAVNYAWKRNQKEIALVTYRDTSWRRSHIHFLNIVNGEYEDNTLGEWSRDHEYRFIRVVHEKEFLGIATLLTDSQKWLNDRGNFIGKYFANKD